MPFLVAISINRNIVECKEKKRKIISGGDQY